MFLGNKRYTVTLVSVQWDRPRKPQRFPIGCLNYHTLSVISHVSWAQVRVGTLMDWQIKSFVFLLHSLHHSSLTLLTLHQSNWCSVFLWLINKKYLTSLIWGSASPPTHREKFTVLLKTKTLKLSMLLSLLDQSLYQAALSRWLKCWLLKRPKLSGTRWHLKFPRMEQCYSDSAQAQQNLLSANTFSLPQLNILR